MLSHRAERAGFPAVSDRRRRSTGIERAHHADAGEHGRPVALGDQEQGLGCGLPFWPPLHCRRQSGDVVAGIEQGLELAAFGQRDRRVECGRPGHVFVGRLSPGVSSRAEFPKKQKAGSKSRPLII